jgi:hypothetical protein
VYLRYLKILLFGFLIHLVRHFMRTGIREKHNKIGASEFVLKIRRHLCEYFGFAVIAAANFLVFCRHAVVAAYNYYAHNYYQHPLGCNSFHFDAIFGAKPALACRAGASKCEV